MDDFEKNKRFLNMLQGLPPEGYSSLDYASPEEAAFGTSSELPEDDFANFLQSYPVQPQQPVAPPVLKQRPASAPVTVPPTSTPLPEVPQENFNYLKSYDEAKQNKKMMDLIGGLSRGSSDIAAGISRGKADYGTAEMFEKQGAQGIADVGERQKVEKMQEEFNSAQAERDPNSNISKSYRDLYKKMNGGKDAPGNPSAAHLKSLLPQLEKMYFIDQRSKDAAQAKADKAEVRNDFKTDKLDKETRDRAERFVKSADKEVAKYRDQELSFSQVDDLIKSSREGNQVAFNALGTKMAKAMGEVGALTESDVTRYVKGGALSRRAGDTVSKWLVGKPSEATLEDLVGIKEVLQNSFKTKIRPVYERNANSLSKIMKIPQDEAYEYFNLTGPASEEAKPPTGMVHMKSPDGREFDIPSDKVEAAKKRGLQEVK